MKDLSIVDYYLTRAEECSVQTEFVYFAMKYLKEDPGLSIEEACKRAFEEWVK